MMTTNEKRTAYTLVNKYYATSNGESNSKFAPVRKVIYKIPSIDECIKHLPRDVGNHILSYTTAWVAFYLENIRRKYDEKFFRILICEWMFWRTHMRSMNKKTWSTDYLVKEALTTYTIMSSNQKSLIPVRVSLGVEWRQQQIALKAEIRLQKAETRKANTHQLKMWIDHLVIGTIIRLPVRWGEAQIGIVIHKKTTTYTILKPYEYHLGDTGCDVVFNIHCASFIEGEVLKEIKPVIGRRDIYFNGIEIKIKETDKGTKKLAEYIKQQIREAYNN